MEEEGKVSNGVMMVEEGLQGRTQASSKKKKERGEKIETRRRTEPQSKHEMGKEEK
jgi:hypothetical protein